MTVNGSDMLNWTENCEWLLNETLMSLIINQLRVKMDQK